MIIDLLKDINDELNDTYHDERIKVINKCKNTLKKIHELENYEDFEYLIPELIDKSGKNDPNILIPLIPYTWVTSIRLESLTNQKSDSELNKKMNRIQGKIEARKMGIYEKIEEIWDITDDDEYVEAIEKLFWNNRLDEEGYPEEIYIDCVIYNLLPRKDSDFDYDTDLIREGQDRANKFRDNYYNWENYFITLDYRIMDFIDQMKDSNAQFTDFTISQLYAECDISRNNHKQKEDLRKALFKLFKKYTNFKPKGESRYRLLNPDTIQSDTKDKVNYKIIPKMPFYQDNPDYDPKHKFIKFLNDTIAVPLDPDMLLVPFKVKIKDDGKFKTIYFYFTVNNRSKTINLRFTDTGFEYANQQSNFYYQLRSALTPEQRNDYQNFESYILKELQTATGQNSRLSKKMYTDFKKLINNKYVDSVQIEV